MRALITACLVMSLGLLALGCGGGENEDPEASTEPSLLGFNEDLGAAGTVEQPLAGGGVGNELLAAAGASFVRVPINWSAVERAPGASDYTLPDAIAEQLDRVGLRPLWVLTSAPCWASELPCQAPQPSLAPSREAVGAYASFAAAIAERYPDAVGIEVWNEPNLPNFWRPTPDPSLYRQLLAATAEAVHSSASEVPVVMAGPSPTTAEQAAEDPKKIPFVPFIEEVMAGPEAPDVDAIGTHPHSLLQRGPDAVRASIDLFELARQAAAAVAPQTPVWVTEVGLTTAGQNRVSEAEQAAGLAELVATFADEGVPVITVHRFFDQAEPLFPFEAGFGVVEADRVSPKPAFCAAADALQLQCEA